MTDSSPLLENAPSEYHYVRGGSFRNTLVALVFMPLISACVATDTGNSETEGSQSSVESTAASNEIIEEIDYGAFSQDQLYNAIVAELAAQRGQMGQASEHYFKLAFDTRDPAIVRRAIQFASAQGNDANILELGLLWAEVSPENADPHLLLSFQFLEAGRLDLALSHMEQVIEAGGEVDFTNLSNRSARSSAQVQAGLLENLQRLSRSYPEQESIVLALVQLLARAQQFEGALARLDQYESLASASGNTALLRAQLHQGLGEENQALRTLAEATRRFPADSDLRLSYARFLIQNERFQEANEQFQVMVEQNPNDYDSVFSMAMLNMEMAAFDAAIRMLNQLIVADQRVDDSQFYLGYIYEQENQLDQAIEHYRKVRTGTDNFIVAQQQATRLAINLGRFEEAHEWLARLSRGQPRLDVLFTTVESNALILANEHQAAEDLLTRSLNKYPNDVDLLFARVLLWDQLQNRVKSEADLRQIILMKPEDSRALNHLGYMLADQTERYEEALELLERAIAISPDDPAIIDSLAWAQYKLGNYADAEQNLRRAFAVFPDHEVASHLGEVLWVRGKQSEAQQVWESALEARPDSELLRDVMERFGAK